MLQKQFEDRRSSSITARYAATAKIWYTSLHFGHYPLGYCAAMTATGPPPGGPWCSLPPDT